MKQRSCGAVDVPQTGVLAVRTTGPQVTRQQPTKPQEAVSAPTCACSQTETYRRAEKSRLTANLSADSTAIASARPVGRVEGAGCVGPIRCVLLAVSRVAPPECALRAANPQEVDAADRALRPSGHHHRARPRLGDRSRRRRDQQFRPPSTLRSDGSGLPMSTTYDNLFGIRDCSE